MDSAAVSLASPASDDRRFWDRFRTCVDTILEDCRVLAPPASSACTVTACFWRFDFVLFFLLSCANVDVDTLCFSVVAWSGVWRGKRLREDSDAYLRSRLRRRVAGAALRHPHQRAEDSIRFDTPISSPIVIHCHVGGDLTAAVGLCGRE
jgi:hypothetical protein